MIFLLKSNTFKFHVKLKFSSTGLPKRNGYGYIDATIQQLLHLAVTLALVTAEEILFPCNLRLCSLESHSLCSRNWVINSPWLGSGFRICFKQMDDRHDYVSELPFKMANKYHVLHIGILILSCNQNNIFEQGCKSKQWRSKAHCPILVAPNSADSLAQWTHASNS